MSGNCGECGDECDVDLMDDGVCQDCINSGIEGRQVLIDHALMASAWDKYNERMRDLRDRERRGEIKSQDEFDREQQRIIKETGV